MSEAFSKSADQIGPNDIQSLIDLEVPEGQHIEFKETLPAEEGSVDPWIRTNGKKGMGKYARDCLLEEVVAFANAYGGVLILGVEESSSEPPVATNLKPLPNCADLVGRLRQAFRDCVEPQIPRIEIFAVATKDDEGVVFIRVGKSRIAPHRVWPTRSCKIRRADRSEEMSMREIQDMTLNLSRGVQRVESQLIKRAKCFPQEWQWINSPQVAFGIRATAVPLGDEIRFERVFHRGKIIDGLHEPLRDVSIHRGTDKLRVLDANEELETIFWRPILRAARADSDSYLKNRGPNYGGTPPENNSYREVHCDGLVELGFVAGYWSKSVTKVYLPPDLPVLIFANLLVQADRVRNIAGMPMAEFAIEVEVATNEAFVEVGLPGPQFRRPGGPLMIGPTKFPLYPLDDSLDIPILMSRFYQDFFHAMGEDFDSDQLWFEIQGWPNKRGGNEAT